MKPIKALISLFPGGKKLADRASAHRRRRKLRALGDAEQIFTHYYEVNQWKDPESVSGVGSTLENTKSLRGALPRLFQTYGVRTILDAPCGDYNWFDKVERPDGFRYIGGDIVKPLIDSNQSRYGSERTRFIHLDIVSGDLPACDLWMCRDCLIHLSYADIREALKRFFDSDIDYLLTTVHPECEANRDIPTGDFRLLNLGLAPFLFPSPVTCVDDSANGLPPRVMGLWRRQDLQAALAGNPWFVAGPKTGDEASAETDL